MMGVWRLEGGGDLAASRRFHSIKRCSAAREGGPGDVRLLGVVCVCMGLCVCVLGVEFTRRTLCLWGLGPRLSACEIEKGTFTAMKEEEVWKKKRKLITALQVLATGST